MQDVSRLRQMAACRVFRAKSNFDRVTARQLRGEARDAGLRNAGRAQIPSTDEYVGSTVVMFSA